MTHQDRVLIEKAKQLLLNIFKFGLHGSQTFCREPTEPAGEEGGGGGGGGGRGGGGRGEGIVSATVKATEMVHTHFVL